MSNQGYYNQGPPQQGYPQQGYGPPPGQGQYPQAPQQVCDFMKDHLIEFELMSYKAYGQQNYGGQPHYQQPAVRASD